MAQIDTSMYGNLKAPDILGGIAQGMKLKDMANQMALQQKDIDFKKATDQSYDADSNGNLVFNPQKLAALATGPNATISATQASQYNQAQTAARQAALEQHMDFLGKQKDAADKIWAGVVDAPSYMAARVKLIQNNLGTPDELPEQYTEDTAKQHQMASLTAQQKLDQFWKQNESKQKDQGLLIQKQEADAKTQEANTGVKKLANEREDLAIRRDTNSTTKQNQALQQTQSILESARGNPEVMQAGKDRYAAAKLNSLLGGDPNNLSPQMVQLAASEVAKIAQGGVPQSAELQHLTPNSIPGSLASAAQMFVNHPVEANQGAFLKQYQDYANKLNEDANGVIKDKFNRVIETRKAQLGNDNYQNLKAQYLDPFEKSAKAKSAANNGPPVAPKVGEVQEGHVFLGGDPANPNSWKAQ